VKYLYQDLLNYIFDVLEGKRESVAPEYLLKSVEIALAGKISKENAFEKVKLRELTEYMPGYDGNQFEKEYAANLVNK
jgi:transposase